MSRLPQAGIPSRLNHARYGSLNAARVSFEGEETMFDNLDDQIANDVATNSTQAARLIRYLVVAVASVVLFGGLFLGVWLLEY